MSSRIRDYGKHEVLRFNFEYPRKCSKCPKMLKSLEEENRHLKKVHKI